MDFSIKACDWTKGSSNGFLTGKSDCIVIGVFESQTLSGAALEIDAATKGLLTRIIKAGDMDGKAGTTLFLHEVSGIGASRVLLVGLGKQDAFSQKAYGEAVRAAWRALLGTKIVQVTFTLAQLPILERSADWGVRAAILALRELTYRFTQMKSKPDNAPRALKRIVFSVNTGDETCDERAVLASYEGFHTDDFHADAARLTVPSLLMTAQNGDVVRDEDVAELQRATPAMLHVRVPNAGHMIPWDNAAGFYAAFSDFLGAPLVY